MPAPSESSSRFPLVSDPNKTADQNDKFTTPAPEGEVIELPEVKVTAKADPTDYGGGGDAPVERPPQQAEQLQYKEGAYQYLRKIDLTLYASTEKGASKEGGLSLSLFRVDFRLTKATNQSPNFLDLKVYNLAPASVKKIRQFGRVQLSAGYRDNFGMIFDGRVVMYITGKDNPVDSTLNIIAGDQDEYLNNSMSSLTFPPGTKPEDQVKTALRESGQAIGEINLGSNNQPTLRSSSYLGDTQRFIRHHMNATGSDFYIDDGRAYAISRDGYRASEIVKLTPTTGLVGFPRVTPSGIECMCLLNPKLRIGGRVKIELTNADGSPAIMDIPYQPGADNPYESTAAPALMGTGQAYSLSASSLTKDGIYKIAMITHHGDTHGNPWYSELICSAGEGTVAPGTAFNRKVVAR
jgi:hypothetical protein